uniref:U3 small nucleolar RNA-associated protein 25 n=1 Tax=Anthurium amnicola TaxID=1678845 RepID=A0A1D1YM32_9ARAE
MGKHFSGAKKNKIAKGLKRIRMQETSEVTKGIRKIRCVDDRPMLARCRLLHHSDYSSEESLGSLSPDEEDYKGHLAFDSLLKAFSSSSQSLSDAYKMRQREQEVASRSDDENSASEASGISEEDENEEGSGSEYRRDKLNILKRKHSSVMAKQRAIKTVTVDEVVGSDHVQHTETEDQDPGDESGGSTFHDHFGRVLNLEEIDGLMKLSRKLKWEMPAVNSSMSKWVGTGESFMKDIDSDGQYGLLLKLYNHWLKMYEASGGSDFHSSMQRQFFSLCNSYRDIMHGNKKPFYLKGAQEDSSIMDAYIMHAINHVFRMRNLVIKNDGRLSKDEDSTQEKLLHGIDFRDQGFTRPKVLFLLPHRSFALRLVKRLIQLTPLPKKGNVEHLGRFYDEFGTDDSKDENVETMLRNDTREAENLESKRSKKPEDHQVLFGGNNDDCFVMGIKFTRKSIKLFGDFYSCDMIVASPLGLSQVSYSVVEVSTNIS